VLVSHIDARRAKKVAEKIRVLPAAWCFQKISLIRQWTDVAIRQAMDIAPSEIAISFGMAGGALMQVGYADSQSHDQNSKDGNSRHRETWRTPVCFRQQIGSRRIKKES
jgi:hypothetical protein